MRRVLFCVLLLLMLCLIISPDCRAASADADDAYERLREAVPDETLEKMRALGVDGALDDASQLSFGNMLSVLLSAFSSALHAPLASCAVIVGVLILSSALEGYTHSLRYTETRDIMAAVTALMTAASLVAPLVDLIRRAVGVISDTASLMLIYVPVTAGLTAFGGRALTAGGTCAGVMAASQAVAQLSARFFPQLMSAYLAIAISGSVSGRVRLGGVCEMLARFIKWFIGIVTALFSTVLSLQSVITQAGDTVASRAARMALSSVVPLIGSALSDAYRTVQGSMDLLRSGVGVFVIIAVLIAYLPVVVQAFLWLTSVRLCECAAQALGVVSPVRLFGAVASVIGVLIALIASTMTVFIISSAVLMRAGGAA